MSKKGKYFNNFYFVFLTVILFNYSCSEKNKNTNKSFYSIEVASKSVFKNVEEYERLYNLMSDTLNSWLKNNLIVDTVNIMDENKTIFSSYKIDSIFCISADKKLLIANLFVTSRTNFPHKTDVIWILKGAQINKKWYFWHNEDQYVYRTNFNFPLTYNQLHEYSIRMLNGYLNQSGQISNSWFENVFQGDGWSSFKERYKYKYILNGNRIDNENDYWDYIWKGQGLKLWISKFGNDSIVKEELKLGRKLSDKKKRDIFSEIERRMMNSKN